jgi:hypothetical protein
MRGCLSTRHERTSSKAKGPLKSQIFLKLARVQGAFSTIFFLSLSLEKSIIEEIERHIRTHEIVQTDPRRFVKSENERMGSSIMERYVVYLSFMSTLNLLLVYAYLVFFVINQCEQCIVSGTVIQSATIVLSIYFMTCVGWGTLGCIDICIQRKRNNLYLSTDHLSLLE